MAVCASPAEPICVGSLALQRERTSMCEDPIACQYQGDATFGSPRQVASRKSGMCALVSSPFQ